jgi:DNA polymerase I-like protein with 3'-5' exonuclease and polymerase domains
MAGNRIFFLQPDEDISGLLSNEKLLKIFHNAKFDLQFLQAECNNIFDTYLAERLLTAGITPLNKLSLKDIAWKYTGKTLDKSLQTSFEPGQKLTSEQVRYAAQDVEVLEAIFEAQKEKLLKEGLQETALLEFAIVPAVAQIERNGVLVALDKLEVLNTKLTGRVAYLEEELRKLINKDINFNSPAQVKVVLHELGFGVVSTDKKALKKIAHPFAETLLEHREVSKLISSFVKALPKHINSVTGRVHSNFHQLGADTGRFTCSKPNLQQIPKEQEWRDLFIASPGHKLITADYNQIELRILAEFSQDPVFLEAYRNGKDLHQETADKIGGSREAAKEINFGLCYGMGSTGLAEKLGIGQKEAQGFITAYFKAYPQVKATLDDLGLKAVSQGFSQTPLGRKRYFNPVDSFGAQKGLERQGRNTPIQSCCGDILKQAIRILAPQPDINILNLVHDEIVFEVPEHLSAESEQVVKDAMIQAGEQFIKSVPVEVDTVVDTLWRKS